MNRKRLNEILKNAGRIHSVQIRADDFTEVEREGKKFARVEVPVATSDPLDRGGYIEELKFDNVDLRWAKSGNAPVFFGHNRGPERNTPRARKGNVVGARIDGNTLYNTLEFALEDPDSREIYDKIQNGLARNVSIGWRTDWNRAPKNKKAAEWIEDPEDMRKDKLVYNYWSESELSIVDLPADQTVGFGRDEIDELKSLLREGDMPNVNTETEEVRETRNDPTPETNGGERSGEGTPSTQETTETARDERTERNMTLSELRESMKDSLTRAGVEDADIEKAFTNARAEANGNPVSSDDIWREALTLRNASHEGATDGVLGVDNPNNPRNAPNVHTREHEVNCGRMVESYVRNGDVDNLRTVETDILDQWLDHQRTLKIRMPDERNQAYLGGQLIPHACLVLDPNMRAYFENRLARNKPMLDSYRATFDGGTTGFHVQTFNENIYFAALKENAPILQRVTFMPGQLYQNFAVVAGTGGFNFTMTDAAGTGTALSGLIIGNRTWTWHQSSGSVTFQLQALDQSQTILPTVMMEMDRDLANHMATMIIQGSGSGNEIHGIIVYDTVEKYEPGTNGDDFNYAFMSGMRARSKAVNARGMKCWVVSSALQEKAMTAPKINVANTGVWGAAATGGVNGINIDGEDVIRTNNTKTDNPAKGSSGPNLHSVIYGDPGTVRVGMFSALEVLYDKFTVRGAGEEKLWVRQAWDAQPEQPKNFVVSNTVKSS